MAKNKNLEKNSGINSTVFKIVVFCIVSFIYISDGFEIFPSTEDGGATDLKRILQSIIGLPILISSFYFLFKNPKSILNPFVFFIILKLIVDATTGIQIPFILECILVLVTLIVLNSLSFNYFLGAVRIWVNIAVFFASLALIKIMICLIFPELLFDTVLNLLGRSTETVALGPFIFGRSSSYASEPSLNVLFFLMPVIASILLNNTFRTKSFIILMTFCLFSFSGSILLSLGVAFFIIPFLIMLPSFDIRIIFPYVILIIFILYLYVLNSIESTSFADNFDFSNVNESFNKSTSFEIRALLGGMNAKTLLNHPLGLSFASKDAINIPGPLLISVGLAGGWISILIFLYFIIRLSNRMYLYRKLNNSDFKSNLCIALLTGAMFNFIIFNDYLIINYNGIIILTFIDFLFKQKLITKPFD